MSDQSHFAFAWQDYQRRRWFFSVWFGGFLIVALLASCSPRFLMVSWPLRFWSDLDDCVRRCCYSASVFSDAHVATASFSTLCGIPIH
jgi:hypothetical protein